MELALTIIAGIGILLFVLSYLSYLFTGFKHHFVTGIISALPVLNVVTLPALWHKAGKTFLKGLLGLILFAASWFFGAEKGIKNIASSISANNEKVIDSTSEGMLSTTAIPLSLPDLNDQKNSPKNMSKPELNKTFQRPFFDDRKLVDLPSKALYRLAFETVPIENISTLSNRIVRVKTVRSITHEGQIIDVNNNIVLIKSGLVEQEIPIANIMQLQLMVKK